MRKSFFKKLSLGLALALVLGTTAQAGTAKAAETWALKKDSKTLYLNADNSSNTKDNYDFNFKSLPENYKKLYNFSWEVADETVATHSKSGKVQAVSVGKTTIECIVTSKENGKVVAKASADIIVKENADRIEITNKDEYDVVKPGEVVDLNRAMYNAAGQKTTKRGELVTDYTRWVAYDYFTGEKVGADVVSINQKNGKFTMLKTGSYKLVAETYQSNSYKQTRKTDSMLITVENPFDVKQTTEDTFTVTLESEDAAKAMNDVDSFFIAKSDDHDNNLFVKEVSYKGNVVTVAMFEDFIDGQEYTVKYGKWTFSGLTGTFTETDGYADTFVASVGTPAHIEMVVKGAEEAKKDLVYVYHPYNNTESTKLELRFYDDEWIDITDLYFENPHTYGYVDFENENNDVDFVFSNNLEHALVNELEVTAHEAGRYALTIVYTVVNAETNKVEEMKFPVVLRAVEKGNATLNKINENYGFSSSVLNKSYETLAATKAQTGATYPWIAANDEGMYLVVTAEDSHNNLVSTAGVHANAKSVARDLTYDVTGFTFKSENNRIATIDERSGFLTPNAPGKVKIAIYYADPYNQEATPKFVTHCTVEVKEAREIKSLTFDAYSVSLVSNVVNVKDANGEYKVTNVTHGNQTQYTFIPTLKDQYGKTYPVDSLVFDSTLFSNKTYNNDGSFKGYTFNIASVVETMKATDKKSVEFTTKVWVAGEEDNKNLCKTLRVTVRKPATDEIKSYAVELAGAGNYAYAGTNTGLTVSVFGINYEGYRVKDITLADEVAYAVGGLTADEYAKAVALDGELFYVITKDGKVINPVMDGNFPAPLASEADVEVATGAAFDASVLTMEYGYHKLGVVGYTNLSDRKPVECNVTTQGDILVNDVADGSYVVTLYQIKKSAATGKYGAIRLGDAKAAVDNTTTSITVTQEVASIEAGVSGVTRDLAWYTDSTLVSAVMECFDVRIGYDNGTKFTEAVTNVTPIAIEARLNDNVLYVRNIKIFTPIANGVYAEHTVYVGKYINVNRY